MAFTWYDKAKVDQLLAGKADTTAVAATYATQALVPKTLSKQPIVPTRAVRRSVSYLTAVVRNPLPATAYTNEPAAIKAEFNQGEVLTADHLTVLDANGTAVPFQWENAVNPHDAYSGTSSTDPNIETDNGTYADGSLRAGTIWIMVPSLAAGATARYSIRISDATQNQTFTQKVVYTAIDANTDELAASGGIKYRFGSGLAWNIRHAFDFSGGLAGADYFSSTNGVYATIRANGTYYNSYTAANVQTVTHGLRNTGAFGYGVVFQDYFSQWNWVNETGVWTRMRYRVFANSKITVENYTWTTAALTSNQRKVLTFTAFANTPTLAQGPDSTWATFNATTPAIRATVTLTANIGGYEATPADTFTSDLEFTANSTGFGFQGTTAAPTGAYWTIRQRISTTSNYASGDETNEWLRSRNPLVSRATRYSLAELKAQFISLASAANSASLDWYDRTAPAGIAHGGAAAMLALFDGYFRGVDRYADAVGYWNAYLTNFGWTGVATDYLTAWANSTFGIEYHGRDIQAVWYLYLDCVRTGRDATVWRQQLLAYADFIVQAEARSYGGTYHATAGTGDGSVLLRGNSADVYNAQAAAIVALTRALALGANATYTATLNRIATHFAAGFQAQNFIPYQPGVGTVTGPSFHYGVFSVSDVLEASLLQPSLTWTFDPRGWVNSLVLPLGQIMERIATADPNRRGVQNAYTFAAACMVLAGTPSESDWEEANTILRFLLSRSTPGATLAPFEGPIDGYAPPVASVNGVSVYTDIRQCLAAIYHKLM